MEGLEGPTKHSEGWRHRLLEVPSWDENENGLGDSWGLGPYRLSLLESPLADSSALH